MRSEAAATFCATSRPEHICTRPTRNEGGVCGLVMGSYLFASWDCLSDGEQWIEHATSIERVEIIAAAYVQLVDPDLWQRVTSARLFA